MCQLEAIPETDGLGEVEELVAGVLGAVALVVGVHANVAHAQLDVETETGRYIICIAYLYTIAEANAVAIVIVGHVTN